MLYIAFYIVSYMIDVPVNTEHQLYLCYNFLLTHLQQYKYNRCVVFILSSEKL